MRPIKNFGGPIISLERLNLKSSNLVQRLAILILATGWHITNKRAWLLSQDCSKILPFVVMQRDPRVCQRQLSYLLRYASEQTLYAYRQTYRNADHNTSHPFLDEANVSQMSLIVVRKTYWSIGTFPLYISPPGHLP